MKDFHLFLALLNMLSVHLVVTLLEDRVNCCSLLTKTFVILEISHHVPPSFLCQAEMFHSIPHNEAVHAAYSHWFLQRKPVGLWQRTLQKPWSHFPDTAHASAFSLLKPSELMGEYHLVVTICCHSLCQCVSYPFLTKTSVLDISSAEFPKNFAGISTLLWPIWMQKTFFFLLWLKIIWAVFFQLSCVLTWLPPPGVFEKRFHINHYAFYV